MPELPEVETIRLGLTKRVVGLTIKGIEVRTPRTVRGNLRPAVGEKVVRLWRRAKILGMDLSEEITLLFHLKMTGQLIFEGHRRLIGGHPTPDMEGKMPNSSTRVIISFSNGSKLFFNDQRRFGWMKIIQNSKFKIANFLGELGPEPLERSFSWEVLKENLMRRKNLPIKVALMDQTLIAGIGNIYASESLFSARIDPRRKVSSLSDGEFRKLHWGIVSSLKLAIRHGGSTRAHFVDVDGKRGYFLDYAHVYGKEGQKCWGCPGQVTKITQAGRGTYFCPSCQK